MGGPILIFQRSSSFCDVVVLTSAFSQGWLLV